MSLEFVDTHAHLHFPDYDEDRAQIIEAARQAGVKTFVNVGTDVATSEIALQLAQEHDFIFAAAGIHPHDAKDASDEALKQIERILEHPRVVALGEIGLDFFRDHSPHDVQRETLRKFLAIYKRAGKPLIIHCRDAYDAFIEILEEENQKSYRGVMHCFSSNKDTMLRLVEMGFYISFAGPLTYKKNDELREACRACPEDRILLETDAPFLPPQSKRGKRNENAYMMETAQMAAEVRGITLEELGRQTTQNAKELFGL